ncbi:ABC transporter permease [Myxococcus sp. CA051A]|uniref:Transport permease protein n=1 Tax=Myxococcus llanfairpwllgwyngyllgogerychwyrndrobwllllantysiliogogogochensis TaxID=2590453 RepID=A0A540X2Z2_9BACT|nr:MULTISPECIES: ABC transporter permease [Myxococcus]NTX01010.1 ABC transporter permease [Myxococcus sp. CA040A]NTX12284.1 ABC transporter permease [Myxococcus sp. CA056]NTX33301.1 ABC transporter permease [Myxococcus sp. CA033]NTX50265.1 ABC transporter permease [Myxococcus sp. CA039A]NTX59635.1 ABC transporter permease [Myxococcus sp. CA051A]
MTAEISTAQPPVTAVAPAPSLPGTLALQWATVRVLMARDVVRFFRQPSRVVGALAQPILFWFVIGSGFAGSFRVEGAQGLGYQQFFFPGVVTMVLLFSAIFATITVIEDRREGFLQAVLAGPGSRLAVVLGKALGSSAIALMQASLFLLLAPLAGVSAATVNLPLLFSVMVLSALALTGMGMSLAWWVRSSAGYHAVMSIVLLPMWVLSGAMFPLKGAGTWLSWVMVLNPMRFSVEGVRRALYGAEASVVVGSPMSGTGLEVPVLLAFATVFVGLAAVSVSRRE